MANFKRYAKYEVMKLDDIEKFLSKTQRYELLKIIHRIQKGRKAEGKMPCNSYVVVNEDMPYAEQVWQLIQKHWEASS